MFVFFTIQNERKCVLRVLFFSSSKEPVCSEWAGTNRKKKLTFTHPISGNHSSIRRCNDIRFFLWVRGPRKMRKSIICVCAAFYFVYVVEY